MPEELWMEVCNIVQEAVIKTIPKKKKCKKAKWLSEEALKIAEKRRDAKGKEEKDILFIIGDWNSKVGSQKIPGVTGKFGLGVWNKAGQRLIEFCQENALVITNIFFQQHRR